MINKLQVQCGHNTVSKIKTMFEDMIKSRNVMAEFKQNQNGSLVISGIEFQNEILTSGHWPYQPPKEYKIPPQLDRIMHTFTNFYTKKFANRTLVWLFNQGNLLVKTTYLSKNYQIIVNCPQATILNLFNQNDSLTCKEIKERTNLSKEDFIDAMMKLCNPKVKVLLK